jgi:protein-disulfide isomerase
MRIALLSVLLAACAHPAPPPAAATSPTVATIGGERITLAEIDKVAARALFEARSTALDKLVTERVLAKAAKAAGKPVETFIEDEVAARVTPVTEAEAKAFFEKNKDRLPEEIAKRGFDDVKPLLIRGLTQEKRRELASSLVDELRAKAGVKILLEAEKVNVAAVGPSRGPSGAKVTIVEFSDFQCPYCARGRLVMDEVVKAYGNDVRLVFRDFPLSFHPNAQKAAEAGRCADEQGKFWPMHDWMFENQDKLSTDDLKAGAKQIGADATKFAACLDSGKHAPAVAESQRAGEAAGVTGTPAFFVNGRLFSGAQPFEKFKAEIDRQLGR